MIRSAFPDLVLEVGDIVAEGDRVALRYTLRGTYDGDLMGLPPTGRRVSSDGIVIGRFEDGRVVERSGVQDMLTMLQQVGALPAPEAAIG
jgi:predicted ester cyclase